jgi:hypothetical protein
MATEILPSPLIVTCLVADILQTQKIAYFVTGSIASGIIGEPRSTNDVDFVVELNHAQAQDFVVSFQQEFYLSSEAIQNAIAQRKSFNLIHLETAHKVDFFVSSQDAYAQEQMRRRQAVTVSQNPEHRLYIASAEDILISKLNWYVQGNEVSDRQWRDILGILKIQSTRLDYSYLRQWAGQLHLSPLLEKAISSSKQ